MNSYTSPNPKLDADTDVSHSHRQRKYDSVKKRPVNNQMSTYLPKLSNLRTSAGLSTNDYESSRFRGS